jgi:hypothetical protein
MVGAVVVVAATAVAADAAATAKAAIATEHRRIGNRPKAEE